MRLYRLLFMPGRDGRIVKDNRALNSLVRLLHRQHFELFQDLPQTNGFQFLMTQQSRSQAEQDSHTIPTLQPDVIMECPDNDVCNLPRHSEAVGELPSTRFQEQGSWQTGAMQEEHEFSSPRDCHSSCSDSTASDLTVLSPECLTQDLQCLLDYRFLLLVLVALSTYFCPNPTSKPYLKARKFLHSTAQWVNVPRNVVVDLIKRSQGAVLANLHGLVISNGSVALPRSHIQEMFEVIDDCIAGIPYVPSDSVIGVLTSSAWVRVRRFCGFVSGGLSGSVSSEVSSDMQCMGGKSTGPLSGRLSSEVSSDVCMGEGSQIQRACPAGCCLRCRLVCLGVGQVVV